MNGVRFLLFFFLLLHCQIVFSDTNTLDTKTLEELAIGSIGNIDKAGDCEKDFEKKVLEHFKNFDVKVEFCGTRQEFAKLCNIEVLCAVIGILN